MNKLFFVRI